MPHLGLATPCPYPTPMPRRCAIVTFTTDFGVADSYVAEMKAAVLRLCRDAILIDVTHQIAPQDILAGSIALERAVSAFGDAIHIAVVDPGVGTNRRLLLARIADATILCPDNGLITWPWRRLNPATAFELTWRPKESISPTFHGRDILAPAAGRLAAGNSFREMAKPISDPILLPIRPAMNLTEARILHIDHFGNATTNVPAELLDKSKLKQTYSDVRIGQVVRLVGSSGLVELAVRQGSAAKKLKLQVGQKVKLP